MRVGVNPKVNSKVNLKQPPLADANTFRPVLLLPTFNNAGTLGEVIEAVEKLGHAVWVVDDGSTDSTSGVLEAMGESVTVLKHALNQGKGAALRTGFAVAAAEGFTHALTIDTDGQHHVDDAPALLEAAKENPMALVTGFRDASDPDYPAKNRAGRWWSNLAIFLIGGRRVTDSQCGMRVYPLAMVAALPCRAGRYGYEAEILVRSGWAETALVQVPVQTIYAPADERVSHFKPGRDSLHAVLIYLRLGARALWPWPYRKWPVLDATALAARPALWRRVAGWFDPRALVEAARGDDVSRASVAAGLGVGAFVANLPVYPVQTLVAVYLAKRLHLHPVGAVAGSQLAFPPMNVILSAGAIWLGHTLMWGTAPAWSDFTQMTWDVAGVRALMHQYFFAWMLGGVLIGVVLGFLVFGLAWMGLKWVPAKESDSAL
ncbi:MAG: DUF2062 domain-containing protein [Algisphaera sp.]